MEEIRAGLGGIFKFIEMNNQNILNNLIGSHFNIAFKQLDLLIINFNEPITLSLHIGCMVRICNKNEILLTIADEFFTQEGYKKTSEQIEQLDNDGYIYDPNSLLAKNLEKINRLLNKRAVKSVQVSNWMDCSIWFDNDIVIQIFPDCLMRDFEYFRIIEFKPNLDEFEKYESVHRAVLNVNGRPTLKLV